MKINFYAMLRREVGQKTVEVPINEAINVQQLVTKLVVRFPGLRDHLLDEDGKVFDHIHVFINGRDARSLREAMDTVIKPEDNIDIFPPVGGG